jgi:hypothetical protein
MFQSPAKRYSKKKLRKLRGAMGLGSKKPVSSRLLTAYHEAAHAVMGHIDGLEIAGVTLDKEKGQTWFVPPKEGAKNLALARMIVAANFAERMVLGKKAGDIFTERFGSSADKKLLYRVARKRKINPVLLYVECYEQVTMPLLRAWPVVVRLAGLLYRHGEVTAGGIRWLFEFDEGLGEDVRLWRAWFKATESKALTRGKVAEKGAYPRPLDSWPDATQRDVRELAKIAAKQR